MSKKTVGSKITFASFKVQISVIVSGILISEFFYFALAVSRQFIVWAYLQASNVTGKIYFLPHCIALLILVAYFWARGGFSESKKILMSFRLDLFLCLAVGLALPYYFNGIGHDKYYTISKYVYPSHTLAAILIVLSIASLSLLRLIILSLTNRETGTPVFISDDEIKRGEDDLLGLAEKARLFSQRLYNGGSKDSVVFGIDAPWGIGKSSFLNFCIQYLENDFKGKVIIYRFDPLKHEDPTVLQEKFISGLVKSIQAVIYLPEISSLMSRYSKILKGKMGFTLFGLRFEPNAYSVDEAFDDLEGALAGIDRKIMVVIDDLDRLDFSTIKDILFSIKKSFSLPNLSYVLCYDTENISDLGDAPNDKEKVREFLEKFVNIKLSIFLDSAALENYVSKNFDKVMRNNKQIEPVALGKLKFAVEGIKEIYKSDRFYDYQPFLNDIRKLKRLINIIISLDIESTDFENSDINNSDLIHLLLIYVNYPNVFRKIYDTETGGRSGYFSLVTRYDEGFPSEEQGENDAKLKNSVHYKSYISGITIEQRFLLDKIFCAQSRFSGLSNSEPGQEESRTYACFNRKAGARNLEQYLQLIVSMAKPKKIKQYTFYLRQQALFKGGKELSELFAGDDFSSGENQIKEFWQIVVNGARELPPGRAEVAINYLVDELPNHSFIEIKSLDVGIRIHICRYISIMLDRAGWKDSSGGYSDNAKGHVIQIANWIFGTDRDASILARLMADDRGVIGIFDVLLFRLQCSANRDGDLFNLTRSLALHSTPPEKINVGMNALAIGGLREMSQYIYLRFKEKYIDTKKNYFSLIDNLNIDELSGKYSDIINVAVEGGELLRSDLSAICDRAKSHIKSFCIYQLGNSLVDSGVGCGYYDAAGSGDKSGIRKEINDYLFEVCFSPTHENGSYIYFIEYLLLCFDLIFDLHGRDTLTHRPTRDQFTRVLDKDRLSKYWVDYRDEIITEKYPEMSKFVFAPSYTISYKEGLPLVYDLLDEFFRSAVIESTP